MPGAHIVQGYGVGKVLSRRIVFSVLRTFDVENPTMGDMLEGRGLECYMGVHVLPAASSTMEDVLIQFDQGCNKSLSLSIYYLYIYIYT